MQSEKNVNAGIELKVVFFFFFIFDPTYNRCLRKDLGTIYNSDIKTKPELKKEPLALNQIFATEKCLIEKLEWHPVKLIPPPRPVLDLSTRIADNMLNILLFSPKNLNFYM